MKRAACLLLLFAACGTSTPDAFEYKATAGWNVGETPNVTSVTIDGAPYASGETYNVDEIYPTYKDARAAFVPRAVVITTSTETLQFDLAPGACDGHVSGQLLEETDQYYAWPAEHPPSIEFFAQCGMCITTTENVDYCARVE